MPPSASRLIVTASSLLLGTVSISTLGCSVGEPIDESDQGTALMSGTGSTSVADDDDGASGSDTGGHSGAVGEESSEGGESSEGSEGADEGSSDGGSETGAEDETEPSYSKTIRIAGAQVSGTEALTDFPVFVSLVDADLHDRATESGCDIAFFQGATPLDFELEQFERDHTETEAKLAAWVRIPSLAATEDTVISLHYGLPCGLYGDEIGVWGADYELVWHMGSDDAGLTTDSTINGFDGSLLGEPQAVEGKLGRSLMLDGIDDRIEGPYASDLGIHSDAARTFSVWANIQHYEATTWGGIFGIGRLGGGCCLYTGYGITRGSDAVSFSVGGEWSQNANWSISEGGSGFDEWVHYAAVYDGDLSLRIYANGQLIQDAQLTTPLDTVDDNPLRLPYADDYIIGGPRDEMRISKQVLSGDWIATEYNNQDDPGSFYEVGPEVAMPVG
ncbi:MAG: LamG-like jellyroll fold domain-containing protein [Myxococcota bacterium]